MVCSSVCCGSAYLTIAHALWQNSKNWQKTLLFMVQSRYKSCVFPYGTCWCILAKNTCHPRMCIHGVHTKWSRYLVLHCKTFNKNAEKPTFYSSTVVYFTLAGLLAKLKVQEVKFRDCNWCISVHFASVYFDDILKIF